MEFDLRILLVAPATHPARRRRRGLFPPLSLLTVAGLTPAHHQVELVDEAVEPVPFERDVELVGITTSTACAHRAYYIADRFRERGVTVVLGGIHASALPEEAAEHADAVVVGEAEGLWEQVLEDYQAGRLQRIYRHQQFPRLDSVRTRRELIRARDYVVPHTVQTTRGCPYDCAFCSVTAFFGATYRKRPVEAVVEEVRRLAGRLVVFVDDNLLGDSSYARQLLQALKSVGKRWLTQASLPSLRDDRLVSLAAEAGCRGIFVGFESLSRLNLQRMRKAFNVVERYRETIERLHRFRIGVVGSFVFGFDEDDESVFERTLRFVQEVKIDLPTFSILTPFPGTRLHEQMEAEGRITDRNWSHYTGNRVVFRPLRMSAEALQQGFRWALRKAYSLPSIWQRIAGLHSRVGLYTVMNLIYRRGVRDHLAAARG